MRRRRWLLIAALVVLAVLVVVGRMLKPLNVNRLRSQAETATKENRWSAAADSWAELNRTPSATGATHFAEATALLQSGRALAAERALKRAVAADPTASDPWLAWLELLRLEDRRIEAIQVGWTAYESVSPANRRAVLRALTLALLADAPDDVALPTLRRFAESDSADLDARVALIRREALAAPGPGRSRPGDRRGDPNRQVQAFAELLEIDPEHLGARVALGAALLEAGAVEQTRALLDAWPESARTDPRYLRLLGQWHLDHGANPSLAADAFRRALAVLPHDWKTRAHLSRALLALGQDTEARRQATLVDRHRELLDPAQLGPRLTENLSNLDSPSALQDLSALCSAVGLDPLADAWRREADLTSGSGTENPRVDPNLSALP